MKKIVIQFLLIMLFTACANDQTIELFVSPQESENAIGSLDDPHATIPQAVATVRAMRQECINDPITIYLLARRHQLTETLVLGTDDRRPTSRKVAPFEEYGSGELAPINHLSNVIINNWMSRVYQTGRRND